VRVQDLPLSESSRTLLTQAFDLDSLYPIQELAVEAGALEGANVLLSAPTASGKTLVPLVVMLQEMEKRLGKVLYMVPLRALAYEKYLEFKFASKVIRPNGKRCRVGISTGDYDSTAESLKYNDVIICTFEKTDSIIRHKPSWLRDVSTVVFDEIHLLYSSDRGPVVEMLVASTGKLLPGAQKIALSATVSNDEEIASWVGCKLVKSDWRPVPLHEGVYFNGRMVLAGQEERVESRFGDELMDLTDHATSQGGQILFFTPTRRQAVSLATKVAPVASLSRHPPQVKELEKIADSIVRVEDNSALGTQLSSLVRRGVAFHHAGLPSSQRRLVEDGFRRGFIVALTATPTLAAGVNLPARYVCVTSVHRYSAGFGPREISVMEYKQMAGRAGRPQFDDFGVALIRTGSEGDADYLQENYIRSSAEPIRSMLGQSDFFSSAVLSSVTSGIATSLEQVHDLFSTTLLSRQRGTKYVDWRVRQSIRYLTDIGALEPATNGVRATRLGRRISELYVLPETAATIIERISKLSGEPTDITLLHLVVGTQDMNPILVSSQRDYVTVGDFLEAHSHELFPSDSESSAFDQAKTVMALKMWVEESPFDAIHDKLGVEPGDLHAIVEKATWLLYAASELAIFAGRRGFSAPLTRMTRRSKQGVKSELLDLVSLPGIGRVRARSLFKAGVKSRSDVARASVERLSKVPGIGPKIALSIKKQTGGMIKKKDLSPGGVEQQKLFE